MPDPFDFDAARRALEGVPAPDLWAEAQRRAEGDAVVPLTIDVQRQGRSARWLAVAAVAALAVGTVAVLGDDGDTELDTTNRRDAGAPLVTAGGPSGCTLAIGGDPLTVESGPADPPLFDTATQPAGQTIAHVDLGAQVAEVHVPGFVVRDLVGERVEQVELDRGTAEVWFGQGFVQVRWFTGTQEACDSFTVTVAGGTEDANRDAAVDLADRVLLRSDLEGPTLRQTAWQLERSTVDGVPTAGNGSTFRFRQNDVLWTDGCNELSATFDQSWPSVLDLLGDITSTLVACGPNPTTQAINMVMRADPDRNVGHATPTRYTIRVRYDGELLILTAGDTVLTLRPMDGETATTAPRATSTSSTTSQSGVRGTITAGPTCPVERPDQPCPPQPLAVHILAIGSDGTTVAETESAGDGSYQMALPAGHYTLRVDTGGTFPTCPDSEVTVEAGAQAVVDITCDTGIR
ncbi:MAG: META domain-containing protein [Acidimicrobiales bacterium]